MAGTTTYFGISYPQSTDLVKDGAANMQTIATGFDSAVAIPTYNNQTGTTYTFALSDIGKTVTANNAGASTYTIPPTASVTWPSNTTLRVVNLGAGVVTFAAGAGVTVTNTTATLAQYQAVELVRTGLNAWTVIPMGGKSGLTLVKAQTIGTAVSSVTVTGAFSATYENYLILVSGGAASINNTDYSLTLGATGSNYYSSFVYTTYASTTVIGIVNNNTIGAFAYMGAASVNTLDGRIEINSPFLTKKTFVTGVVARDSLAGRSIGHLNDATSYTAFTLTPTGATFTGGTIYVYGYGIS
jgi:cyanophycinase-like exopeptidase